MLLDTPANRRIVNKSTGREIMTDYKVNVDDVPAIEKVQDDIEYLLLEADQIRRVHDDDSNTCAACMMTIAAAGGAARGGAGR